MAELAKLVDWIPRWGKSLAILFAAVGVGITISHTVEAQIGLPQKIEAAQDVADSALATALRNAVRVETLEDDHEETQAVLEEIRELVRVMDRRQCRRYAETEDDLQGCDER